MEPGAQRPLCPRQKAPPAIRPPPLSTVGLSWGSKEDERMTPSHSQGRRGGREGSARRAPGRGTTWRQCGGQTWPSCVPINGILFANCTANPGSPRPWQLGPANGLPRLPRCPRTEMSVLGPGLRGKGGARPGRPHGATCKRGPRAPRSCVSKATLTLVPALPSQHVTASAAAGGAVSLRGHASVPTRQAVSAPPASRSRLPGRGA